MNKQHFTNIAGLTVLALLLTPIPTWATDCQEADRLYKRSLQEVSLIRQGNKLIEAINKCPNHQYRDALMNLANRLKDNGDLLTAEWLYNSVTKAYPNFAPAYAGLGEVLREQHDHQGASDAFQKHQALQRQTSGQVVRSDSERLAEVQNQSVISYPEIYAALIKDKGRGFGPPKLDIQVQFASNSHEMTLQTQRQCQEIAEAIKGVLNTPGLKNSRIRIEGHTDNRGSASYNRELSLKRAKAVTEELVKLNVPADRLKIKGWGEDRPIATNKDKEGRATNRRVTLVRIDKQQ